MRKKILTKESNFTEFIERPLVADDINAYEICLVCNEDLKDCIFEVSAERADGKCITDLGEIQGNKAIYIMKNSMYLIPGELKLRLKIMSSDNTCLTAKELHFTVLESTEQAEQIEATDEYPLLTKLITDTKDACEKAENVYNMVDDKVKILAGYLTIDKSSNRVNSKCDIAHEGRVEHKGFLYHDGSFQKKGNALFYNNLTVEGDIIPKGNVLAQKAMNVGTNLQVFKEFNLYGNGTVYSNFTVKKGMNVRDLLLNGRNIAAIPKNEVFDGDDKVLIFNNQTIFDIDVESIVAKGTEIDIIRFVLKPEVVPQVTDLKFGDEIVITANDNSTIYGVIKTVSERVGGDYSVDFNNGTAESILREMPLTEIKAKYKSFKVIKGYEWKSKNALFEEIKEYINSN